MSDQIQMVVNFQLDCGPSDAFPRVFKPLNPVRMSGNLYYLCGTRVEYVEACQEWSNQVIDAFLWFISEDEYCSDDGMTYASWAFDSLACIATNLRDPKLIDHIYGYFLENEPDGWTHYLNSVEVKRVRDFAEGLPKEIYPYTGPESRELWDLVDEACDLYTWFFALDELRSSESHPCQLRDMGMRFEGGFPPDTVYEILNKDREFLGVFVETISERVFLANYDQKSGGLMIFGTDHMDDIAESHFRRVPAFRSPLSVFKHYASLSSSLPFSPDEAVFCYESHDFREKAKIGA